MSSIGSEPLMRELTFPHADAAPWATASPSEAGFDPARLSRAVQFAEAHPSPWSHDLAAVLANSYFEPPPWNETLGLVKPRGEANGLITRNGRLVTRWGETRQVDMTFSIAKSYLSILAGIAYDRGLLPDPDEPVSNTTPPKVTLIALAIVQGGALFALQAPARRWLARRSAWTATVLINANIMTLFIWHLTATTLVVLGSYLAGGVGLHLDPGSTAWWWSRIPWVAANAIALAPLVLAFGRFERPRPIEVPPASPWRYVIGALAIGGGLALLAGQGVGGYGPLGLNVWGLALAFTGICLISRFAQSSDEPA